MSNPQHSPTQAPSPKRRRVALACQHCRERKVRCDGQRPTCGACLKKGIAGQACEYLVIADTAKYQTEKAYLTSLQSHIAELGGAQPSRSPRQTEPANPAQDSRLGQGYSIGTTFPMSLAAMGAAVPCTPDTTCQDQYYGQSSLVSLVHQYAQSSPGQKSIQSGNRQDMASNASPESLMPSRYEELSPNMATLISDDFSLPPRRLADRLLDVYFTNNHVFYPWVHKESFLVTYESIWTNKAISPETLLPDVGIGGRNCSPGVFHCALNAMFAIACEFSDMEPRDKRNSSMMFYERMKSLMNVDILDSGSLAHVQALLMVSIYLQCTPYPKRCWNVIGMAHRIAVGLGLHNRRQFNGLSALEKEMRWRAWCACVQMDVIISMTTGRPPMTHNYSRVPLPSPIDDKYLAVSREGRKQPDGIISSNEFLHQNMKLIGILWKVLLTVYHNVDEPTDEPSSPAPETDFKAIMEIDRSLEDFEESLPDIFTWKLSNAPSPHRTFRRQSNVLHARCLHLKLLLYRPTFSTYCSNGKSRTGQSNSWTVMYQQNAAVRCVRAACDLILSLSKATIEDSTGAWWYGVFYLISAGIVLVLVESSGADFPGILQEERDHAWDECLETLNRMVSVHPSARDYHIALHDLRKSHTTQVRHANNGPEQSPANEPPAGDMGIEQTNQLPSSMMQSGQMEYGLQSPFFHNWDADLGDIMLPAQFLQNLDEELLLPNLF
ncbi:unnamed protein product [Penicillium salamii]|nr:unnamed protein product [Penicillium salamii]